MFRGTTPTITMTFPADTDFTGCTVYVSISDQNMNELMRIDSPTVEDNVVSIFLSQEQTLALPSYVLVQVNWTYGDNLRGCSNIAMLNTKRNLINEVLA